MLARVLPDDRLAPWKTYSPPPGFERNGMFLEELRHFQAVLHDEAEPSSSLQDGIKALQISLAVLESSHRGQEVKL
jgi:predicted dehydrogenase